MSQRIALFWPGDLRQRPNELARPNAEEASLQIERALTKLGRQSYRVPDFISKPHHAIEKLGPIDDPLIGVCVHWFYGPHTTEGVVGKDNPLLLASNFSGQWPGLVGLLNTGACLESLNRPFSRIWTTASDWTADETFMARLEEWCSHGRIRYAETTCHCDDRRAGGAQASPGGGGRSSCRRALVLMLGDTSMGMISETRSAAAAVIWLCRAQIDQAWIWIAVGARPAN
jgi:hypothetical protein